MYYIIYCINDNFEDNIMNLKELVTGVSGEKQFLLGNEAAVRGVIEAGVSIAATYPGTPSSEIGNILSVLVNFPLMKRLQWKLQQQPPLQVSGHSHS